MLKWEGKTEIHSLRMVRFAKASVVVNALLAIGKICFGIFTSSLFVCVNAFYNVGMGLAKHYCLLGIDKSEDDRQQYKYYRIVGVIISLASLVYMIYSVRMFVGHKSSYQYSDGIAAAIAAITFTEIAVNAVGYRSSKKRKVPLLQAIKLTSLASSIISLVLTQTAIMSFAYGGDASFANGLSGIAFGGCAAMIGLYMVIHATAKMKKITEENPDEKRINLFGGGKTS